MPKPPLALDPAATALLIIECQNGVVGASGALPDLAAAAAPILPAIGKLAADCRLAGVSVVHLTYVPAFGNRSSNRKPVLFAGVLNLMNDWTAEHPATQVVEEIGVGPDDLVLARHSGLSPTHSTELYPMLRNAGITTVLIAGVSVNVAIPVAATEAADEGFDVIIARDTVIGTPPAYAQDMVRNTLAFIARIVTAQEVTVALGSG